jgi:hypothetical protein
LTSRSWPASSKAIHSAPKAASISKPGEVWPRAAIEYALESGEDDADSTDDPERWLPVHGEGSREGYRDIELFIASVEDAGRAERLAIAIRPRSVVNRGRRGGLACRFGCAATLTRRGKPRKRGAFRPVISSQFEV